MGKERTVDDVVGDLIDRLLRSGMDTFDAARTVGRPESDVWNYRARRDHLRERAA